MLQIIGGQLHPDEQSDSEARAEEISTGPVNGAGPGSEGTNEEEQEGDTGAVRKSLEEAVLSEMERAAAEQEGDGGLGEGDGAQYEFLPQESQLLELMMNGMRVAGLALALEALSTFMLGDPQPLN